MGVEIKTSRGVVESADPAAHGGALAFLGIPYAESPLTPERRLREPVPVGPWDGVRLCDTYGASAPQPPLGFTIIPEPIIPGDNCLNLNVFTPDAGNGAGGLPVFVWIHGGGFTNGCNASAWYHGRSFARDGVVTVAVNYRLGAEGFAEVDGAPTNRAVRDWLLALAWVQDNIAAFGGDPGNVTIAGQSAGSVACGTLVAVPSARGLFRRAVLMSGGLSRLPSIDVTRRRTEGVAAALGVDPTRDGLASVDPDALVAAQSARRTLGDTGDDGERDAEAERPHVAIRTLQNLATGMRFGPVIDGDLLPEAPLDVFRRGGASDIALLVGTTAEEVDRAVQRGDADDDVVLRALEAAGASAEGARAYRRAFPDDTPVAVLGHAATDVMFRMPVVELLEARAAGSAPAHAYEFQWRSPTGFGSVHCLDIPFVWDVLDADKVAVVAGDDPPQQLADAMHRTWLEFIRSGSVDWPAYEPDARAVMAFDAPDPRLVHDPHAVAREAFS